MSPRTGLLSILLPDETSRRAYEETLADWRDEWQAAASSAERLRISTRGWLSIARVAAAAFRAGLSSAATWSVLCGALLTATALSLLLIAADWSRGPLLVGDIPVAFALLVPQGLVSMLGLAAAIGFGARATQPPRVITIVPALVLIMAVLVGWVFPTTNRMYREYVVTRLNQDRPAQSDRLVNAPRGLPELTGFELLARTRLADHADRTRAWSQLFARLGLVVSVPVFLVFGIVLRHRLAGRVRWGIARFVAGASVVGVFLGSSLVVAQLRLTFPAIAAWPEARGFSIWLATIVLAIATLLLARTSTSEPGTLNLEP